MHDVVIAGAGPAGSIAALVLARAGARVLLVDRESFPRDKLCGDTVNPGALDWLAAIGLAGGPLATALPLRGMLVSGPFLTVRTRYGEGVAARAITRRDLDAWLLESAIRAGAEFESGWVVRRAIVSDGDHVRVRGLAAERRGAAATLHAPLTIAADGRRSAVALGLKLIAHPRRPRRWAFGVYASGVKDTTDLGEMHIRAGRYLGIAPVADGLANVCVVTGPRPAGPTPLDVIRRAIARDRRLARRFEGASFVGDVRVLGPLAVEARAAGTEGLLLAGDAAGFIDPMTGDGLHLAMRGGALAADEALRALATGDFAGAPARLAAARAATLGAKLRFNRALRALVGSRLAIEAAEAGALVAPFVLRRVVRHAGDVS